MRIIFKVTALALALFMLWYPSEAHLWELGAYLAVALVGFVALAVVHWWAYFSHLPFFYEGLGWTLYSWTRPDSERLRLIGASRRRRKPAPS